jgi:hypothetical protein
MRVRTSMFLYFQTSKLFRTLGIYSDVDGKCLSSIQISATAPIKPPNGIPMIDEGVKTVWKWRKMTLGTTSEVFFSP